MGETMSRILKCNVCGFEKSNWDGDNAWDTICVKYEFGPGPFMSTVLDICPKCSISGKGSEQKYNHILDCIQMGVQNKKC